MNSTILVNKELAKRTNVFEKLENHGVHVDNTSLPDLFEERKRHFSELFHWSATNTLGTKLSLKYPLWKRDPTNDLRVVSLLFICSRRTICSKGNRSCTYTKINEKYFT